MTRVMCLAIAAVSLAATPGCSSCMGSFNSCRRPSFMEFRSCGREAEPCAAPAAPVCAPACGPTCEPACGSPAPCCEGGMSAPAGAPIVGQPGTFS
jgi:hypothetical protein